jgi:hypothetical protein
VSTNVITREATLKDEIIASETLCRSALEADYPGFVDRFPMAPKNPEDCFELLCGIPYDPKRVRALLTLKTGAERAGLRTPYAVERFIVLQAYLVSLSRLLSLPVDQSVNRQFCATCRQVASPVQAPDARLALKSDAFAELAQIITLRRFHAGQLSFDIMRMPRAWLLKVHPIELPGLIREITSGFGGLGPVVMPHINYWRSNPLFILHGEQQRALWRIAKSIEYEYHIKGLIASSWLYSLTVGEIFPYLAWVRDFFIEHNAYVVDAGPALADAGFLVGSKKRQRLYSEGNFHPRETLVLWRRADMLAWANRSLKLREPARPVSGPSNVRTTGCPHHLSNLDANITTKLKQYTLIDCKRLLYYKPRRYIMIVLLLPALCAAMLSGASFTVWSVLPIFGFVFFLMWLVQYFFLQ